MNALSAIFLALTTILSSAVAFFIGMVGAAGAALAYLLARLGKFLALVSASLLLISALIVCMRAFIASIAALLVPPAWLLAMIDLMIPTHFLLCFSTIIAAKTCRSGYDFAMTKLKLAASAL